MFNFTQPFYWCTFNGNGGALFNGNLHYDELTDSFAEGQEAGGSAEKALEYIKDFYEASSIEDIQYYARKARNEIEEADSYSDDAASKAADAEDEANDIYCDNAEDEADNVEVNFESASNAFDDAYTYLKKAEYAEEVEDIKYYLEKLLNSIEEGRDSLEEGMSGLGNAVEQLNECD